MLHLSPSALCAAEWILADYPFQLGGLPVAWQVSARPHPDTALAEWNAYFTTGTPHEALADFLFALDARTEPVIGFDGPDAVLTALTGQGWIRDLDNPETTPPRGTPPAPRSACCPRSSRTATLTPSPLAGRHGRNRPRAPRTGRPAPGRARRPPASPGPVRTASRATGPSARR